MKRNYDNPTDKVSPTPAALAFASRITVAQFLDVYLLAHLIDEVAEESRANERNRILSMGAWEILRECWKGKRLYVRP